MLFINISSDKIYLDDGQRQEALARNGIENVLGPTLVKWYQEAAFDEILLLNGPGGFTNLRVGTLMLNLLNTVNEYNIQIFSVDKLTMYGKLVAQGILPHQGIIYLGQKHNVWLGEFANGPITPQDCQMISLGELPGGAFLDELYDPYRPQGNEQMIQLTNKNGDLCLTYQGQTHTVDRRSRDLQSQTQVQADYMIAPTMN